MDYQSSTLKHEGRVVGMRLLLTIFVVLSFCSYSPHAYAQMYSSTSTVTVTAIVPSSSSSSGSSGGSSGGGGGGGGGGGSGGGTGAVDLSTGSDSAVFKGLAYPGSIVTLLKNGVIAAEVPASPSGVFEITLRNIRSGAYTFGILAEDSKRLKSKLDLYTVYVASGVSTQVEGVFIPPTITSDKSEVKRGDPLSLMGSAVPNAGITILVNSETQLIKKTQSNSSGAWLFKLDSLELEPGNHEAKSRASTEGDLSLFSDPLSFVVGTVNKARTKDQASQKKVDLNNDSRVNLLDFSIIAYWYKRSGFPEKADLNGDGRVDLADVSILAYNWTG